MGSRLKRNLGVHSLSCKISTNSVLLIADNNMPIWDYWEVEANHYRANPDVDFRVFLMK